MAMFFPNPFIYILTISILLSTLPCQKANNVDELQLKELNDKPMKEKLSHFRVYWHDIVTGRSPTSIPIIKSPPNSTFGFGTVNMIDNPLTLGPQLSSKSVGKAQGFYAYASQEEFGLLMNMNFVFTYGKYNGSTIAILGRNAVFDQVREMLVVGGSGLFRFARGYAEARTHTFDLNRGDAIVEYNVYVMHY